MPYNENTENDSESIKVFVRILPLLKHCDNCMKISSDKKTIFVRCLRNVKEDKNPLYWSFKSNGIFYDCSQNGIYRETTRNIINKVLDGANCVMISCGQTGTGKSFTLSGLRNNWEHRGLVPRLLADLLVVKAKKKYTNKIHYRLSYVEFRGRKINDLLNPHFQNRGNGNKSNPFKNVTSVSIKGEKDALRYIFEGEGRRAVAEGSVYPGCHLGTAVITFHVHNTSLITSWAALTEAAIHIVEMAGIDTTGKANCPKNPRDVIAANSMKLEMEHFFASQGKSGVAPSPFPRSSVLIKYLGEALTRRSVIRFIAHVRVTKEDLGVALSTLRLAAKIARLQPLKISYKVKPQNTMIIENLNREVTRLKRELDVNEMFFGQEAVKNVSKNRAEQIEKDFLSYLNGTISDVKLMSLSQAQVLAKMMKDVYAKITAEKQEAHRNGEKCDGTAKNTDRKIMAKTSIRLSDKDTTQNNNDSKDRISGMNTEAAEGHETHKVGTLNESGITLGPGLAKIPASLSVKAFTGSKPQKLQSREQLKDHQTDEPQKKRIAAQMKKEFKVMQKMLTRMIETGPESRKRWDNSTTLSRPN